MELDFQIDTSWCMGCERQILPKRSYVPIPQQLPPQPPTPTKQSDKAAATVRQKKNAVRGRGGLAHGTGRVKQNGAIRRSDSNPSKNPAPEPAPVDLSKQRLVIEQGPTPLYCSDECRIADLNTSRGIVESDFHPDRQPPPPPPVPHNSFSSITFSTSQDSESDSSSTTDSSVGLTDTDRCHARLAPLYGFPPLPPRPHLVQREPVQKVDPSKEYQSGVMMAAQRIKANLFKEEPKRSSFAHLNRTPSNERKHIPGWTDGTDGWRAEIYSFSKPRDHTLPVDETADPKRAYKGFVASSQRQGGVYSTLDSKYQVPQMLPEESTPLARNKTVDELYSKYNSAFARRSESRTSIHSSSSVLSMARSLPTTVEPIVKKKEVPILKKGAEGKLLVPDVKLKVSTSYVNISGSPASSNIHMVRRASGFSDRSMSSVTEEDELSFKSRPIETRAWSYDNVLTYPCMAPPVRTEKRLEKRIVDGVEKEVEVEVELPLKRLFLFPGKEVR
ncbi:hypothetical protein BJ322DRAFT_147206 [Thelephora terrestris]|uniref:Uncharacterized protein n=1 Tax=Thelephora terrestris TaxID=56493 RepID=A0A9P6HBS4_9AGAM|nr:hypothetical protein BJ322DRAFT_147206 [Thelephora terrestris]